MLVLIPGLVACGSSNNMQGPSVTSIDEPGVIRENQLTGIALDGPFHTLEEWCGSPGLQQLANGEPEVACPSGTGWLLAGHCDMDGGQGARTCPVYEVKEVKNIGNGSNRAQLLVHSVGPQATCFIGIKTHRGWFVSAKGLECRIVGVTNGWLEIEEFGWVDDTTFVARGAEQAHSVESWGMEFCSSYPQVQRQGFLEVCRVGNDGVPACVSMLTEWQRRPMDELADPGECSPDDEPIASGFPPEEWRIEARLKGRATIEIQNDNYGTVNAARLPLGTGDYALRFPE